MKNSVQGSSKLNPTNFVRRVLSRTSTNISRGTSEAGRSSNSMDSKDQNLVSELSLLKDQINSLRVTVTSMQNDSETKEVAIATLAKEKELLTVDLKKQKRSNVNLKQQLEDERSFYYKEKEHYCNEMNNIKKLRRKESKETPAKKEVDVNNYRKEISDLKNKLDQTLEANYNLSIKFLRMKNTKLSLKTQLTKLQNIHEQTLNNYRIELKNMEHQIEKLATEEFLKPIAPSNKKYLQIMKQNGNIIHENLCLQLSVHRLNKELDRMKFLAIRSDTNSKLKYIHTSSKTSQKCPKCNLVKAKSIETTTIERKGKKKSEHKLESEKVDTTKPTQSEHSIHKIFEKDKQEGIPSITILQQDDELEVLEDNNSSNPSKYALMTISNSRTNNSVPHISDIIYNTTLTHEEAHRTQSAPEIFQNIDNVT